MTEEQPMNKSEAETTADEQALEKSLELDAQEGMFADLHAGIRGQIKKIMRPFVSIQSARATKLESEQAQWRAQVANQINKAFADLDQKFKNTYGGFVRKILISQDQKITNAEIGVKALIDETADRLHTLASAVLMIEHLVKNAGLPVEEQAPAPSIDAPEAFAKEFNESVFKRMEQHALQFKEDAERMAQEVQEKAKQKAETLAPATPPPAAQEAQDGAAVAPASPQQ